MKKSITAAALLTVMHLSGIAAIEKTNMTVQFDYAEYQITETSRKYLLNFLNKVANNDHEIIIQGHTDSRGSIAYNQGLSLKRAGAVRDFFVNNGITKSDISIKYFGESIPAKPNTNDMNMSANRRVEVTLINYVFSDVAELAAELSETNTSTYIINPDRPQLITGAQGIKMYIESKSFVYPDGTPVEEDVVFELTEALHFTDFISHNLTTVSKGKQLESGGMFRIGAKTVSGKEVRVNKSYPIAVSVPTENRKDGMEVFVSTSGQDWTQTGQKINNRLDIKMPKYPRFNYIGKKLPRYKVNISTKPFEPKKPRKPNGPSEINPGNYMPSIRWYQILSKKKIAETYAKRLTTAVEHREKRMERYEVRLERYHAKMDCFDYDIAAYEVALEKWTQNENKNRKLFKKSEPYIRIVIENDRSYKRYFASYNKRVQKWRALRSEKIGALADKMDKLGICDNQLLDQYVFGVSQLNWINVDKFYNLKENETQAITLHDADTSRERVFIIFKEMKSMLPMRRSSNGGTYSQNSFPKNADASIFAYKVIDGTPMIYHQDINGETNYQMEFKPAKFREIRDLLNEYQG